jgi:hypothetical protein
MTNEELKVGDLVQQDHPDLGVSCALVVGGPLRGGWRFGSGPEHKLFRVRWLNGWRAGKETTFCLSGVDINTRIK